MPTVFTTCPCGRALVVAPQVFCDRCTRKTEIALRNQLAYAVRIIAQSGTPVVTLECR